MAEKNNLVEATIVGMEAFQDLLNFMYKIEEAEQSTLLYIFKHLRFISKALENKPREELCKAAETFIEERLKEVYLKLEEMERIAEEQSKSAEKMFYINDNVLLSGKNGKKYWTLSEFNYGTNSSVGMCNEFGFTNEMPEEYKDKDRLVVALNYGAKTSFKGERQTLGGDLEGAVIKLNPDLCKNKDKEKKDIAILVS